MTTSASPATEAAAPLPASQEELGEQEAAVVLSSTGEGECVGKQEKQKELKEQEVVEAGAEGCSSSDQVIQLVW